MPTVRQKLKLADAEIRLIKALVGKKEFNDQIVLAFFSHSRRSINHRVIGQIRSGDKPYDNVQPASSEEVAAFLGKHSQLNRLAKVLKLQEPEPYFQLIEKSSEAALSAVAIYNNPLVTWKSEIFIINFVIAWLYALHAWYKKRGIDYRYIFNGQPQTTPDGQQRYWDLARCIDFGGCPLSTPTKENIRYLIYVRNEIEHRLSDNVDQFIEAKMQACVLNLERFLTSEFGDEFSVANKLANSIQMKALRPEQVEQLKSSDLPQVIRSANAAIEEPLSDENFKSPEYSFRVWLLPRIVNHKNQADYVGQYAPEGAVLTIKEVERAKFLPSQIVKTMRQEGARRFNMSNFIAFWKSIEGKNPEKKLGIEVAGHWYWYATMIDKVREYLQATGALPQSR